MAVVTELPEWVVALAGLVTQFGDMWFVLVGVAAFYWLGRRGVLRTERPLGDSLFLFSLAIGGYALTLLLKHTFGLPRPPGAATATFPAWLPAVANPVYESLVTGDGFGFPSGHAVKSAAVFGGAALVLETRERRRRFVVAGLLIALVALSRVVLGVHYLVDVVVGVVVGLLFLAAMTRLARHRPRRALTAAGTLGVLAVAMAATVNAGLTVVAAAVGVGVWTLADRAASPSTARGT